MRSKCIPFILLLIITTGLASCGKAAGTAGSGSPDTAKVSDQALTETPDRSAGDNDPNDPEPSAETDGTSATDDTTAGPERTESTSLSSTAEDSSLSTSGQNPARSSSADSAVPSSEAGAESSKPADQNSDPDAEEDTGMDHKAVRTRPEHTIDDLNPPAPQAPSSWTAPASQTANPSDSNSKKQQEKKEKKEKSKKGNRIGSSMGGGSF